MQKYLFVNKNQTVTTKIEWLYTVSQTYLNIYFPFFRISSEEGCILMIPCLIFLCQVGLHFCWVLNIFCTVKLISSFALFFPVCLELKSSFPIMSQFAWSLFTLRRHECKFIRGRKNIFHQIVVKHISIFSIFAYLMHIPFLS